MEEDINCTTLRQNPELFRIMLRNALEELSCSTMSNETTNEEWSDDFEIQANNFQSQFTKAVNESIDFMWNQSEISNRVSFLHQLELKNPPDFVAWRPTTGEIPILTLKGDCLNDTKIWLLYKIKKSQAENEELRKNLITKATEVKKSLKKISKAEEYLYKLYNEYEKITKDDC